MRISDWSSDVFSSDLTVNEPSDLGIEHSPVAGGPAASSQTDRARSGAVKVHRSANAARTKVLRRKIFRRSLIAEVKRGFLVVEQPGDVTPVLQVVRGLQGRPEYRHLVVIHRGRFRVTPDVALTIVVVDDQDRSEEHTSELQSLMRISYA